EHVAGLGEVGRAAGVAFGVDVDEIDFPAGLAISGAEALRLVALEARLRVLVVVDEVAAALVPDRWRGQHLLAALEDHGRIALLHVGLGDPVGVVTRDDRLRPLLPAGEPALGMAVAAQWIDHRPRHDHAAYAGIMRTAGERDRPV